MLIDGQLWCEAIFQSNKIVQHTLHFTDRTLLKNNKCVTDIGMNGSAVATLQEEQHMLR